MENDFKSVVDNILKLTPAEFEARLELARQTPMCQILREIEEFKRYISEGNTD